jgi:hypothetical protein
MSFETLFLILVNAAVFCAISGLFVVFMASAREAKPGEKIAAPPVSLPAPATAPWTLKDEREAALAYLASPSAFWLDPNRYGDDPDWQARLFPEPKVTPPTQEYEKVLALHGIMNPKTTMRMVMSDPAPKCPVCGSRRSEVTAEHGDEASMWGCLDCITEFTRAGETKKSKQRRQAFLTVLPCGCKGEIVQMRAPYSGYHVSRCETCKAEWEPRSNDPTGRSLGQGESVTWAEDELAPPMPPATTADFEKGLRREAEWKRVIAAGGNDGAGSCPDHYGCGWPVERREGLYYCTRSDCRHSEKGWT